MISTKPSLHFLMGSLLALSACNSGDEIPQKTDKEELEEIIDKNVEEMEQEAKSIKEAAAKAVKIIEQDAQAEIDAIEPETNETIEDDNIAKDNQSNKESE